MKYLLVTLTLLLAACIGPGQNSAIKDRGEGYFPRMTGIDLFGEKRVIPNTFAGDLNIVTVAFEREQQADVDTWIPLAEEIMEGNPNVRFYEIPVIYELNPAMRGWINNGMRRGIPTEQARERTITVYTDREEFLDIMAMSKDHIYTLILDEDGRIVWSARGPASAKDKADLRSLVQR